MCVASWQAIVRARRGGSKATINVRSASRGGLELFYARGGGSPEGWRDACSRALRRIRATAPRSATRLHNRYPAYTCATPRVRTCVRAGKKVKRCVRVCISVHLCTCVRCSKKIIRGYSSLEYSCHAACRKPNWLTWYRVRYSRANR